MTALAFHPRAQRRPDVVWLPADHKANSRRATHTHTHTNQNAHILLSLIKDVVRTSGLMLLENNSEIPSRQIFKTHECAYVSG